MTGMLPSAEHRLGHGPMNHRLKTDDEHDVARLPDSHSIRSLLRGVWRSDGRSVTVLIAPRGFKWQRLPVHGLVGDEVPPRELHLITAGGSATDTNKIKCRASPGWGDSARPALKRRGCRVAWLLNGARSEA